MESFIPEHITLSVVGSALTISAFCGLIVAAIVSVFEVEARKFVRQAVRNFIFLMAFGFPVALIAFISGYLATMGRSSAIGQLLPAMLAFIGAANLYVFGTDNRYRVIISYSVCLFAVTLFYGTQYGAYERDTTREYRLQQLLAVEARIKQMRRNLRLGDDFPSWLLGSEPK